MLFLLLMAALTFSPLTVQPLAQREEPGVTVINDEAEWKRFTAAPSKDVDFAKQTVIAVYAGEKSTAGYTVRVTGVEKSGSGCVVQHEVVPPPKNAMLAQVITYPYVVVRVNGKCATAKLG